MDLLSRRKVFGTWLRNCRKHARITQAELAKTLNYESSQLISNIERGVSLLPSKRLPEFSRALGCSLLEMEVRYFQCSARNTSESRMPDLLLKYLDVIETLEYGRGTNEELLAAVARCREAKSDLASQSSHEGNETMLEEDDEDSTDVDGENITTKLGQHKS
jgi:transcriptional regulator with XRE-family HTH domain